MYNKKLSLVKNDDVMDMIVVFCILFVFMLVLYCFCVATEFSVNKDLYQLDRMQKKSAPCSRQITTPHQSVLQAGCCS